MGAKLLYRDGNGRDASIDVVPEGVFLGRGADCAVRTDDAMVSRKNCKIALASGRWMVEDLGSSNGTFVNEVRIQKQALNHADVVRCGTLQVRFVETADAAPLSNKPKTTSMPAAGSVQIDPSLQHNFGNAGGALDPAALIQQKDYELQQVSHERDALAARLREAMQELEGANSRAEGGNAELQRLRAENVSQRDRLAQVQREKSLQEEEIHEITKAANELRDDLDKARREASENKQRVDELTDEKEAHERQLERAHEDVQRTKQMTEEMRGKLGEIQKAKDDNWKEVNARIAEIDQLRQVIDQQTNLLKERDVGLMTFESTIKELRADKEKLVREQVAIKNERDELRDRMNRQQVQVEALEEEQRRLARMISDGGGGAGNSEEHLKLATEVRELKVELRRVETERNRFGERLESTERERGELEEKLAKMDVDRASAMQSKNTIDAARGRTEEKLAKAEAARVKAEEGLAEAQKGREQAMQQADRYMVEAERERKRAADLELELKRTRDAQENASSQMVDESLHPAHMESTAELPVPAELRVQALEEEVAKLEKALEAARAGGGGATAQVAAVAALSPTNGHSHATIEEIKKKAEEAYSGINDMLSELRTNILLAKDLVAEHGHAVPDHDAARTLEDAINVSVDRTEEAKGLLRALRQVIES